MSNEINNYKITTTAVAVGGSVDSGKCFGLGTEILMYDGSIKKVENISIGDIVMGDDSNAKIVVETHEGFSKMYQIITTNNKKYIVNDKHILCLKSISNRVDNLNDSTNSINSINSNDNTIEIAVNDFINLTDEKKQMLQWYSSSVNFNLTATLQPDQPDQPNPKFSSQQHRQQFLSDLLELDKLNENHDYEISLKNILKYKDLCQIKQSINEFINDIIFIINSLGFTTYELANSIKFSTKARRENFTINSIGFDKYYGFEIKCCLTNLSENGRFLLADCSVVHNSSLVGVLTSPISILDDGNGSARKLVAKHPHEIATGRTSDISTRVYNIPNSNEAVTLVDLCGHETYFKTTTFGVSGYFPDYGFLIVSANRGILPMTKQHMRLFLSLGIPFIIIITHSDIVTEDVYNETVKGITKICSMFGGKSTSTKFINNLNDQKIFSNLANLANSIEHVEYDEFEGTQTTKVTKAANVVLDIINAISDGKQMVFPVITMSSKTGYFLDVIKKILGLLKPRNFWFQGEEKEITENKFVKQFKLSLEKQQKGLSNILPIYKKFNGGIFYIDSSYNVQGIGVVVTGINRGTPITTGLQNYMYIGPFGKDFKKIRIKSLHNNFRENVPILENHHRGCINFAPVEKSEIRREHIKKGMVVIPSLEMTKNICYRFKAVITMFTNLSTSITLKTGYSPVIHMNTIRQTARMIIDPKENNNQEIITFSGMVSNIIIATFKFKTNPEFVEPYSRFLLRSGSIQGIGLVIDVIPMCDDPDAKPDVVKKNKHLKVLPNKYR